MENLPAERRRVFGLPQQRQKAVAILNHCYTNDLLDLTELENRLALLERAETLDELEAILADIPEEHRLSGDHPVGLSEAETVVGRLSTKKVSEALLLTKVLDARITMGTLILDYRRLLLPAGVMELRLSVDMGPRAR